MTSLFLRAAPLIVALTILPAWGAPPKLERLDPHGAREVPLLHSTIQEQSECRVCHLPSKEKSVRLKGELGSLCSSCHGKTPHSGIEEHLSKTWKGKAIQCLDCHSPHRHGALDLSEEPSTLLRSIPKSAPHEGLREKTNRRPMLKTQCTECHRWK